MKAQSLCASTSSSSRPKTEAIATPLPDLDSTVQVGVGVTWHVASVALSPVHTVDLEDTNIEGTVGVVVGSIGITTRLVSHDALAATLVPATIL